MTPQFGRTDESTDAAPSVRVREEARRGNPSPAPKRPGAKGAPDVPRGEVWLDVDVAKYLHVSPRTVKRIAVSPRPGELDLRRANPVFVGDRRWYAENVKRIVRECVTAKAE